MTFKGAQRNVPHLLQAQQAPICLWAISETLQCQNFRGIVTKSTVSNRVCWSLKVLWGSVSADFREFQVGREGKKERKIRDWQEEWMNPKSHIPHLQAQLAFAWHNRLDRDHYVSEAERQLKDSTYYELLDHDPTDEFAKKVSEAVEEMFDDGYITEKNMRYLIVDQLNAGRYYLLPKIHKAGNPGRPIVSANGHPTEKISEFVDLHLQPYVNSLPSYLKDTTDYLRKLQESGPIPPETLLVSLDVLSLYTNISHEDGIRACKEAWEERPDKDPPTEILVKLLTLILKCNNFEFKGKHYLQVLGTAMGTKMAPAYANIFMGRWKDNFSD